MFQHSAKKSSTGVLLGAQTGSMEVRGLLRRETLERQTRCSNLSTRQTEGARIAGVL